MYTVSTFLPFTQIDTFHLQLSVIRAHLWLGSSYFIFSIAAVICPRPLDISVYLQLAVMKKRNYYHVEFPDFGCL